ncbi:MAG TPA: flavodoxin family protein [Negativicutes bacterium]|jgi:multimeric flavodoxin WrbA
MKVLAIIGSPRKNGNTAAMVNAVCKGASLAGHKTEVIYLADLNIHGCIACGACKTRSVEYCAINDDMQQLYKSLIAADCLVFGSPIYMGQITGLMKNFFDRLYAFMDINSQVHYMPGKKYITVTASGALAEAYHSVSDYLNKWLGEFSQMHLVKNIVGGTLGPADAINSQPKLLAEAESAGRSLS